MIKTDFHLILVNIITSMFYGCATTQIHGRRSFIKQNKSSLLQSLIFCFTPKVNHSKLKEFINQKCDFFVSFQILEILEHCQTTLLMPKTPTTKNESKKVHLVKIERTDTYDGQKLVINMANDSDSSQKECCNRKL